MIDKKMEENSESQMDLLSNRKSFLGEMEGILRCEEIHWRQKVKCKWSKERDGNTKFFQSGNWEKAEES